MKKNDVAQLLEVRAFCPIPLRKNGVKGFYRAATSSDSQDNNDEEDDGVRKRSDLNDAAFIKGLEFERVYLVGVEEEALPHKKSIAEATNLNEELRLLVGMTRAKEGSL